LDITNGVVGFNTTFTVIKSAALYEVPLLGLVIITWLGWMVGVEVVVLAVGSLALREQWPYPPYPLRAAQARTGEPQEVV